MKMIDNLGLLRRCKTLEEVHQSEYFKEHFVKKYINDLPRMAYEVFGIELTYQQIEVLQTHNFEGGRTAVPSGHGVGKTAVLGFLSTAFLLLFPYSIVRIQAPKLEQVTKFSFKEITKNINGLKRRHKLKNGRIVENKWAFLHKFFQINSETIYIKGFQKNWYIEAATAPKGDPTNLSGQHGWAYLLIFDEASGIPDTHITGSLGALTQKFNSCLAFSQHTKTTGMFHNFVTTQSKSYGGVWNVVRLNSEQSPLVTAKAIKAWRASYTDNEYNVRVLGLPPLFTDGYLLNEMEVVKAYSKEGKDWLNTLEFTTLTISSDVAYIGIRDSGTIIELRVATSINKHGVQKLYIIVDDIDVFNGRNAKLPTEVAREAYKKLLVAIDNGKHHKEYKLAIDATAGGHEAYVDLSELATESGIGNLSTYGITWGLKRLIGVEKRRFFNQRAKAYIMLQEAIKENRFYIATNKHKTRFMRELANIPFEFTSDFKYKIVGKEEMAKKGIPSPDIADAVAQQFLIQYNHFETKEREVSDDDECDNMDINEEIEAEDTGDIIIEDEDLLGDLISTVV